VKRDLFVDPENDARSIDDLFNVALSEPDEDVAWDAVMTLHHRGSREVLDRAAALARSDCPLERRVGAEVLAQLGCPGRPYSDEVKAILLPRLEFETDAAALAAVISALAHQDGTDGRRASLRFLRHPDADVRYSIVHALSTLTEPWAVAGLIELSRDSDPKVRDWSTFGLGSMIEVDKPEIRAALKARLNDEDPDARGEALVGLARRKDLAVSPSLRERLAADDVDSYDLEAAEEMSDPELLPLLQALRSPQDDESWRMALESAIEACAPA